jgi:hypothetical protein
MESPRAALLWRTATYQRMQSGLTLRVSAGKEWIQGSCLWAHPLYWQGSVQAAARSAKEGEVMEREACDRNMSRFELQLLAVL